MGPCPGPGAAGYAGGGPLGAEPLLGPVDLTGWIHPLPGCDCGHGTVTGRCRPGCLDPDDPASVSLDWVVAGGESGPGARPMHPDWARGLRDQCQAARVPFLFKQWGAWWPTPVEADPGWGPAGKFRHRGPGSDSYAGADLLTPDGRYRRLAGDVAAVRVGKKAAGRLLDGRTWDEYPTVRGAA